MKYIKFLFLSLVAVIAMACDPDFDKPLTAQRFPDAAFYEGDLTEQMGEEQGTFFMHVELHKLTEGGYSLAITDAGTDIQREPMAIFFRRIDGELIDGKVTLYAENLAGMLNLDEHTFASLNAELTADRAKINLDFGDGRVWTCDIEAVKFYLE